MPVRKDYTVYSFLLAATVISMLLLLGLIPSFRIGGTTVKRINILSDVYFPAALEDVPDSLREYADTAFTAESVDALRPGSIEQALSTPLGTSQSFDISPSGGIIATPGSPAPAAGAEPAGPLTAIPGTVPTPTTAVVGAPPAGSTVRSDPNGCPLPTTVVEDYSGGGMNRFYALLGHGYSYRPVRVAVLGDSFIEADIITADLREQLQTLYGGRGPGFVPFSSPLAKYRASVKHTFEGWESYNVLKKKSAPAAVQERFFVSGVVCVPSEGAWTRIEGTAFRNNLARSAVARILFTNTGSSKLEVTVNDSIRSTFTPETSPLVQQIILRGNIASIKVRITSAAGFYGYGVVLEGADGVSVDNFSVRSNSGMALFGTNTSVNSQIGRLVGYDLVILQYGLNAMSPDILSYNTYSAQVVRIAKYVRDCFPGAAVMVMSVGDRSTLKGGQYVTMPAAKAMISAQHKAAEEAGVAFWNTFVAMGGERSMVKFVENKWASKDYTHIGYPGGKFIATEMVRSIVYGYRSYNGENLASVPVPDYPGADVAASAPAPVPAPVTATEAAAATNAATPQPAFDSSLMDHPSLPSVTPEENKPAAAATTPTQQ